MKKNAQKKTVQNRLFEKIESMLPDNYALVDTIAEALEISSDSAYRRLRGDKTIDLEEMTVLLEKFNIPAEDIFEISGNNLECSYIPLDLNNPAHYLGYMQALAANIEKVRKGTDNQILLSAPDVPVFHFLISKELTFFKLYAWTKSTYGFSGNYEEFIASIETEELLDCYSKIYRNYQLTPSTEIWTANTCDTFLRLVSYHYEMGHFGSKEIPLILCEQLLKLIDNLQSWADSGYKDPEVKTPFRLFSSEIDLESTFILLKYDGLTRCILKLFTINSLNVTDRRFCNETENWLNKSAQRSTLISGVSEKERYKFFNGHRQKIRFLIDKIYHNG